MSDEFGTDILGKAVRKSLYQTKHNIKFDEPITNKHGIAGVLCHPSEKKILVKNIAARVKSGLKAYDEDLHKRRQRLKCFLEEEEILLHAELNEIEKKNSCRRFREEKQKLQLMEEEKQREDEKLLALKKLHLEMANCQVIRPLLKKRLDEETCLMQKLQMKEKEEMKRIEKERDTMWHQIMLQDSASKSKQEEEEKLQKINQDASTRDFLDSQVQLAQEAKHKRALLESEIDKTIIENHKHEATNLLLKESEKKLTKKATLGQFLTKQIQLNAEEKKRSKEQEYALQNTLIEMQKQEAHKELQRKLQAKEHIKREFEVFGRHSSAIKAERAAQDKARDMYIAEMTQHNLETSERQKRLIARKSKELIKETISIRDMQMEEKRRMEEYAAQHAAREAEMRKTMERQIAEENINRKKEAAHSKDAYKKFLEKQMHMAQLAKEQKSAQEEAEIKQTLMEEQQRNERMMQLMQREFSSEAVHPFKKIVQNKLEPESAFTEAVPHTNYCRY